MPRNLNQVTCRGNSKDFWNFHPENWGKGTQFDEHIFQMGWNHQPDVEMGESIEIHNDPYLVSNLESWPRPFLSALDIFPVLQNETVGVWALNAWFYTDNFIGDILERGGRRQDFELWGGVEVGLTILDFISFWETAYPEHPRWS